MNTDSSTERSVLVWDVPVRLFHWLLVACFAGAWLTAESEHWRLLHVTLGYTMAGLVAFRVIWGLVGTRYARFASFVRSPTAAWRYLKALPGPRPQHHVGHNPAGGLAVVALLILIGITVGTGWATYSELAGEWLAEVHETVATALLVLVGVHVAGVAVGSWVHRENLVRSMLTGRKRATPGEGIRRGWATVAVAMLAAVLAFWGLQWQSAPAPGSVQANARSDPGHDDD